MIKFDIQDNILKGYCEEIDNNSIDSQLNASIYRVDIPEEVKEIDSNAFYGCKNIKLVVIPEGVESIESNAFRCCSNLEEVSLPKSLKHIGSYAFGECNLQNVDIPCANLTAAGVRPFFNCPCEAEAEEQLNERLSIKEFDCDKDLSKYKDSLLFDSGTCIAILTAEDKNGYNVNVVLDIQGEIRIRMADSDERYIRYPDRYTDEIRQALENGDYDALDIGNNNWFNIRYCISTSDGEELSYDGDSFDSVLSDFTPEELKTQMYEYAQSALKHYYREYPEATLSEKEISIE